MEQKEGCKCVCMFTYKLYLQNEGALGDLRITDVGVGGLWWVSVSMLLEGPSARTENKAAGGCSEK